MTEESSQPITGVREPTVGDLADLWRQTRRDADRPQATLWRRDREIGREAGALREWPHRQVMMWLRHVQREEPLAEAAFTGQGVNRAARLVTLVLVVLGLLIGWGAATAVFSYDGRHPVNVATVLLVFVLVQLLLLVLLAIATLPDRWLRHVPGAEAVVDALRLLSPGRLAPLIGRILPQEYRASVAEAMGGTGAHQQVYGRVQKWQVLLWSQAFAVAFNIGVLLRYLSLVVFTDLAFAWSTTIRTDATTVHWLLNVLAVPWAWLWPDAAPDQALVIDTWYFRPQVLETPDVFAGWWPFVLLCLIVYGLLPRVATLGLALWRRRAAVRDAVLHTPGVAMLLERLNYVHVDTHGSHDSAGGQVAAELDDRSNVASTTSAPPRGVRAIVNWAEVPVGDVGLRSLIGARVDTPVLQCGGARSLAEDRAAAEAVSRALASSGAAVMVVTKSWEPPVLEVLDFLVDLRNILGRGVPIVVMPVAVDDAGRPIPAGETHLASWHHRIKSTGDPWLTIAQPEPDETAEAIRRAGIP